MKITDITLGMLRVPLKTPFKTALRTLEQVEDIVVMLHTDDGHVGYGEAPPTAAITGETHGSIVHAIRHHIAPRLVGEDLADLNRITDLIQSAIANNGSAKAAVEIAVYDLWGQLHRSPVYTLLGGGTPMLTTDLTISVNDVDTMVADALAALDEGYEALKIKVGKDVATDVARVRAIHDAVAGRAALRLDANQGWTAKDTVRVLTILENEGVVLDLIEQPVPAHDLAGMRYVTERVNTPVMADESVFAPADVMEIIRLRAADIINIKLMKAGGITQALRIADIAATHGIPCMMGCMLESSISVAAAVHVAIARSRTITRIDLDGPSLCSFNPVEGGVRFDGPRITVDDAPGLGIGNVRGLAPL
ncbi:dipeptide epimerase [Luteibacter rhizovicinus DSM 16549]|uniref:Dipeptide epimerase n=1 Tax=Luteibacter rhizovicinus DSM 16549 TaxID=1440763 RepID=A0A0G9H7R6_9GAMM|nr:dipeptide epimerase [Luteibacter rhizovicinus]APG03046.1 dipeptide epimerase [Luteibacter rhizovicinus DSM 16549]KLD65536.1 L-alanine-DL-glutamate epimerase [Luteibacter rhizovicinus DSM 16549]KLD79168.1 L-alanine-DL-glutamate epimerase [Xanthomonas hyacinthi DSM 19077]